jgi:hypothetical protein
MGLAHIPPPIVLTYEKSHFFQKNEKSCELFATLLFGSALSGRNEPSPAMKGQLKSLKQFALVLRINTNSPQLGPAIRKSLDGTKATSQQRQTETGFGPNRPVRNKHRYDNPMEGIDIQDNIHMMGEGKYN